MANWVNNNDGTYTDTDTGQIVDDQGNLVSNRPVQSPGYAPPDGSFDPVKVVAGPDTPDPTPTPTTTPAGSSGSVVDQILSFLDPATIQRMVQGGGMLAAAIKSRDALNKAADTYTQKGEQYASQLDPYGSYRKAAAEKLAALQADPSSITNTPGYQFSLSQGLGAVANRDNRAFGVGAGHTNPDLMNFAQGLASKTYNDTIKQYSDQAGVGIGPSAAASVLNTGLQGNVAARLGATNAMNTAIAGATQPGNTVVGPNGKTTNGGTPGGSIVSDVTSGIINSAKKLLGSGSSGETNTNLPQLPGNGAGTTPSTDTQLTIDDPYVSGGYGT